jgi:hypothetical protein
MPILSKIFISEMKQFFTRISFMIGFFSVHRKSKTYIYYWCFIYIAVPSIYTK